MSDLAEPIFSDLSTDPDMLDLVEQFVDELPSCAEAVQHALQEEDYELLRRLAHQLKGAAGGYGFMPISDIAAVLEQSVRDQQEIEKLNNQVRELTAYCLRARAK